MTLYTFFFSRPLWSWGPGQVTHLSLHQQPWRHAILDFIDFNEKIYYQLKICLICWIKTLLWLWFFWFETDFSCWRLQTPDLGLGRSNIFCGGACCKKSENPSSRYVWALAPPPGNCLLVTQNHHNSTNFSFLSTSVGLLSFVHVLPVGHSSLSDSHFFRQCSMCLIYYLYFIHSTCGCNYNQPMKEPERESPENLPVMSCTGCKSSGPLLQSQHTISDGTVHTVHMYIRRWPADGHDHNSGEELRIQRRCASQGSWTPCSVSMTMPAATLPNWDIRGLGICALMLHVHSGSKLLDWRVTSNQIVRCFALKMLFQQQMSLPWWSQ